MENLIENEKLWETHLDDDEEDPSGPLNELAEHLDNIEEYFARKFGDDLDEDQSNDSTDDEEDQEVDDAGRNIYTRFILHTLPKIVLVLLNKRNQPPETKLEINAFLHKILDFLSVYFQKDIHMDLVRMFGHLFATGAKLFSTNLNDPLWSEIEPGDFAVLQKHLAIQNRVPPLIVDNVNYWGNRNGFDLILEKINEKIGVELTNGLLSPFAEISPTLNKIFLTKWSLQVKDALLSYILALEDTELKDTPKQQLSVSIGIIDNLLMPVHTPPKVGEIIEQFRLALALKCLQLDSFEKRFFAIAEINELIEITLNKERRLTRTHKVEHSRWLDSGMLLKWVLQHNILEDVFGEKIHHELVKRSNQIFGLIAQKGHLTEQHLDLLWSSSLGEKQETLVESIYKVIRDIAPFLKWNMLDYLMDKIKELPIAQVDKKVLTVLKRLLDVALQSPAYLHEGKWGGLSLLWEVLQDDKQIPEDLRLEALSLLVESLKNSPKLKNMRLQFVDLCTENLKRGSTVSKSLKLLKKLIDSPAEIIRLEKQHHIVDVIFVELKMYKEKAQRRATEERAKVKDVDLNELLVQGSTGHLKQIQQRLKFLNFIVQYGPLSVSLLQADMLWKCLIDECLTEQERDTGFHWFCTLPQILQDTGELSKYVLEEKLANLDPAAYSDIGFACFDFYFRIVNGEAHNLEHSEDPKQFTVLNFSLIGLSTLWNLVLSARDSVAASAIALLNYLFEKALQTSPNLHEDYIKAILSRLGEAQNQNSVSKINRCITLIERFLLETDIERNARKRKSINEENVPISSSGLLSNNQEFFTQIFQLLDYSTTLGDSNIVSKIWNLLILVPQNVSLVDDIKSCFDRQDLKWNVLLDTRSPFRLLYSLKVITALIEDTMHHEWKNKFVERGGLQFLLSIYLSKDKELDAHYSCLALILKLLAFFLTGIQETHFGKFRVLSPETLPKSVNLMEFVTHLLETVVAAAYAVARNEVSIEKNSEQDAVQYAMTLFVACINSNPPLLNELYGAPLLKDFTRFILLQSNDTAIQTEAANAIHEICNATTNPAILSPNLYFVDLLLELLSTVSNSVNCAKYFKLLNDLLLKSDPDSRSAEFWLALFEQVTKLVKEHPTSEIFENSPEDHILIGLINLMCSVVKIFPAIKSKAAEESLLEDLFTTFLFDCATVEKHGKLAPPKCKTPSSRSATFSLLKELTRGSTNIYNWILQSISVRHIDTLKHSKWNFSPALASRPHAGYVGLKNQGCTCYQNSLLQQLFMIPRFRRGILSVMCTDTDKSDSITYQLQTVFSFLQESQRKFFDPLGYCKANKDYEGNPVDVMVQMDVDEHFNMMCEKLDEYLKNTMHKKLLQNIWCGKLTNQLICRGCPHRYERDDPCYTISIDIKNKKNILEALDLYVKGETLEKDNAYFCEKCSKKRDTLKRACIKTLPNTLILHLKRFEFDFDKMKKVKLNDYCEFPSTLNMEPYTTVGLAKKDAEMRTTQSEAEEEIDDEEKARRAEIEALIAERPPSYYQYNLMGILIHRGTADSGHYYSYIKERAPSTSSAQWFEFNDKEVRPFDPKNIQEECFGGTETVIRMGKHEVVEKSRSAYMLIYERVQFQLPEKPKQPIEQTDVSQTGTVRKGRVEQIVQKFINKIKGRVQRRKKEVSFTVPVPRELYLAAWQDNTTFLLTKKIFDSLYFEFVLSVMQNRFPMSDAITPLPDDAMDTIIFSTKYLLTVLVYAKDRAILSDYVNYLKYLYSCSLQACKWFSGVLKSSSFIDTYLIESPVSDTRNSFSDFVFHLVCCLKNAEEGLDESHMESEDYQALWKDILHCLLQSLTYNDDNWRYFDEVFLFFLRFVMWTDSAASICIQYRFVSRFVNFFLEDESLNGKKLSKYTKAKRKGNTSNYDNLIATIAYIVCRTKTADKAPTLLSGEVFQLHEEDSKVLWNKNFLLKLIQSGCNIREVVRLLTHMSWDNQQYSELVMMLLNKSIHELEYDALKPIFAVFFEMMRISDGLQQHRIEKGVSRFLDIVNEKKKLPKKTKECIQFIYKLIEIPEVKTWLSKHTDKVNWITRWKKEHSDLYP